MVASWFKLVMDYPNTRGPTIPFLLGALRRPPGKVKDADASQVELRRLLVAMRDETPELYCVTIVPCEIIKQLIVWPVFACAPRDLLRIPSPRGVAGRLYVSPIVSPAVVDVDSLTTTLWALHGQVISEGRFSYRGGAWQGFEEKELERIKQVSNIEDREA